jgi:hypothetical protein
MQCEFEGVEKYFADEEGEMPDLLPNPDTYLCTLERTAKLLSSPWKMTSQGGEKKIY